MLIGHLEFDMRDLLASIAIIAILIASDTVADAQIQAQIQIRGNVIINGNVAIQRNRGGGDPSENRTHIGVDSNFERIQKRFGEYIEGEKFSEAVPLFHRLSNYDADFFTDERGTSSIRNVLDETFTKLPVNFRKLYELEYGGEAAFLVEEFERTRSRQSLVQAYRQFFHTQAGQQAAYLLGMNHLDQGNTHASCRAFGRLLKYGTDRDEYEPELSLLLAGCQYRLGDKVGASETLLALREKTNRSWIEFQGRRVPFFEKSLHVDDWYSRHFDMQVVRTELPADVWLQARGDDRQNAISDPIAPVSLSNWKVRTVDTADFNDVTRANGMIRFMQDMIDRSIIDGTPRLPAFRPLVVGDKAIIRAFGPLKAFDVKTGKQLWQTVTADEEFNYLVENMYQTPDVEPGKYPPWDLFVTYRAWKDATTGSISSDGRRVFAIHDVGIPGMPNTAQLSAYRHPLLPGEDNLLRAYDLETGRFLWEVGGQRGDVQLDLAGTFFLGPPVAYEGRLYLLGDDSREIRLICVDPQTGKLVWTQPLVATLTTITHTPDRRLLGLTPSVSQGMILCPTGSGVVIAVDPDRAALLWKYSTLPEVAVKNGALVAQQQALWVARGITSVQQARPLRIDQNWVDSSIVASGKYIAIISATDDTLHLVDSTTGKAVWDEPRRRGHGLFLGGMDDEKVIIVGKNFIEGIKIQDGEEAWPPIPIDQPTGRGIRTGYLYHQPVLHENEKDKGGVVTVDLRSGRILTRSHLPENRLAGNLAASNGIVVSATPVEMFAFHSVSDLQEELTDQFARNDPTALTLKGEIELHLGNETQALEALRNSYAKTQSPKAAQLIAGTLLEGMRADFNAYESNARELRGLLDSESQIGTFLRIYADGLRKAGRLKEAFDLHYEFVSNQKLGNGLERINGKRLVRIDRWVSNELRQLMDEASVEEKQQFGRSIHELYTSAMAASGTSRLRDFLHLFPWHPLAETARWELVNRIDKSSDALEYRKQIAWLANNGSSQVSQPAMVGQIRNDLKDRHFAVAVRRTNALKSHASENDAKQVSKLLDQLKNETELLNVAEKREESIRENPFTVSELPRATRRASLYAIRTIHKFEPEFETTELKIDTRARRVIGYDEYGNELWDVVLPGSGSYGSYTSYYAHTKGNLFAVALFGRLFMIRGGNSQYDAKLLWERSLRDEFSTLNTSIRVEQSIANGNPPGLRMNDGQYIGKVSAFTDDFICYQSGTDLHAVDYITGKKLWTYENAPQGANLMVTTNHVFAYIHDGPQVILNAADGSVVQQRVSPLRTGFDYFQNGYRYYIKEYRDQKFYVTAYEPAPGKTDKVIAEHVFDVGSFSKPLEGNNLLVVESGKTVHLLDPFTGEKKFTHKIQTGEYLPELQPLIKTTLECFADFDHVYLMIQVHDPDVQAKYKDARLSSMDRFGKYKMIRGPVICLDRETGNEKWRNKVEYDGFMTDVPPSLPFLLFATNSYQYVTDEKTNRRTRKQSARYLLINKYTGEAMFDKTHTNVRDYLYSYEVDFNSGHFDLQFSQRTIRVKMQGELVNWPDDIPPAPEMPSPQPTVIRRIAPFETPRGLEIRLR